MKAFIFPIAAASFAWDPVNREFKIHLGAATDKGSAFKEAAIDLLFGGAGGLSGKTSVRWIREMKRGNETRTQLVLGF